MMEMDWESQFRGGNIHGYRGGGSVDFLRNRPDKELMARMMVAEQDKNPGDARKIAHVINNRARLGKGRGTFSELKDRTLSPIARVLGGKNQFTPFHSSDNLNFYKSFKDPSYNTRAYTDYLSYADKVLSGSAIDPTGGSTFFDLDPKRLFRK